MHKQIISTILLLASVFHAASSVAEEMPLNLAEYKGKVVYLDFWASWCVPCRKSFPWMNTMQQQYSPDDLVIIAVNLDKKKELATSFLDENPANFKILYDPKGQLAKKFQIKGMPSSVIFDRNGKPVVAHTGFFIKKISDYEAEIQKEINKITTVKPE